LTPSYGNSRWPWSCSMTYLLMFTFTSLRFSYVSSCFVLVFLTYLSFTKYRYRIENRRYFAKSNRNRIEIEILISSHHYFMVSLSLCFRLVISIYIRLYLVYLFVHEVIKKNIIGVETVVNIRWTTQAEDFVVIVWA